MKEFVRNLQRQTCDRKRRLGVLVLMAALAWVLTGCHKGSAGTMQQPAITFMGWGPVTIEEMGLSLSVFRTFSKQTGLEVHFIPGIESETNRVLMYENALKRQSNSPDVFLVDEIWMGELAEHFADLRPAFGNKLDEQISTGVQNDVVNGKLAAMPFVVEAGILYYRTDLLKKYGYSHPPETWDQLEKMATRIQTGERAEGNRNFWGFVWQGAAYEGLTCNALEWQVSHGGGRMIEEDRTISVNNPKAIAAINRARRWVGTISPPSVTEYKEEDSRNVFLSGNAAFQRDWVWTIVTRGQDPYSPVKDKFSSVELPSGGGGHASMYGGMSLAASKYSHHLEGATDLVRYLTTEETELEFWKKSTLLPARRDFYQDTQYLSATPQLAALKEVFTRGTITRPSAVTGKRYSEVSRAYFTAVHSVLTGEKSGANALSDLEGKLIQITGFPSATTKPKKESKARN